MADVNKTILLRYDVETGKLTTENGKVVKSLDDVSVSANRAAAATDKYGAAAERTSNVNKKLSGSAGLAGAAAFELGRTISDLPFGLVAISNNLSQLGTLFGALIGQAGSFRKALGLLKIQLMNPITGVLLAFQVVNAAITFFAQKSQGAKNELNKLTEEIAKATAKLNVLKSALEDQSMSFENLSVLIKQANEENKNLNLSLKDSEDAYKNNITSIDEYIKALTLAAKAKAVQTAIEAEFEKIIKEQQEQQDDQIASYNVLGQSWAKLKGSIVGFYEGISGASVTSEKKIVDSQMKIKELLIEFEALFRQGYAGDPNKAKEDASKLIELQQQLALVRIKNEEARLRKQLEFIDEGLKQEQEGTAAYIKLQIEKEKVEDSLRQIAKERREKEAEEKKRLYELDKQIRLESINDEIEKIKTRIAFIDAEMEADNISAENFKQLQLEKIKAVNALAAAEEKARQEREKEDNRVNALLAKLTQERLKDNTDLQKKWLESQISSLQAILENTKLTDEQRAQSELDLYLYTKKLNELKQADAESISASIQQALSVFSSLIDAGAERELATEKNKTNALNDELKARLANEQLNADQRDDINKQIAINEARLVQKENEINKKRFEQQKALQIAQALVETYRTSWLAFASQLTIGDPSSALRAKIAQAVALAAGLANVAMIARQKFTGKAMPTPSLSSQGTGGSVAGDRVFNVVGASPQTQIAEAIAANEDKPVKAYVVSSDVTSAQELDRRIVEGASI